jgi:hypothetical protein
LVSRPDADTAEARRETPAAAPEPPEGVLAIAARFARTRRRDLVAISAAVLVPCFWHREIEASDLGSHLYNAWLVQLIHGGEAHGLWIDRRWNNVLFDYLLSGFGALFGLHAGEKIAVAIAVLIFFWGAFALVCAATRRAAWYLLPLIAMAAYGWTFHIGLFNYYLALGLSFFGVAILWRAKGRERLAALALAPLIVLAHPLGLLWLAGAALYVILAERLPRVYQIALLLGGIAALFGVHAYFFARYDVEPRPDNFYFFTGADQFFLYGDRYQIVEYAFLVFLGGALVWDVLRRWRRREPRFWVDYSISSELYVLAFAAVLLLPRGVHIPGHIAALALLTDRLTSISLVLLLCLLGAMRPEKWHLAASAALAAVFFVFLYQDTGQINRMESAIARVVRTLPPGQRVLGTIDSPSDDSRVMIQHILDRACIGYCYSYGNYEPASEMFRVRAAPGNPYVLTNYDLTSEAENGEYTVQPADLPVYEVYQCGKEDEDFCIHALKAGEKNGDRGVNAHDD